MDLDHSRVPEMSFETYSNGMQSNVLQSPKMFRFHEFPPKMSSLFAGQVPIQVWGATQDPKTKVLQVSVALEGVSRLSNQEALEIQITDDLDPHCLYQLSLSDQDFHSLRQEQHLLVDFAQFPLKFIELLQETIKNKDKEHPKYAFLH